MDSNIIFAGLIKKSTTRMILASTDIEFIVPEWVHTELREHVGELARKSHLSEDELEHFIDEIFQIVHTVPLDEYEGFLAEALEIMSEIDPDDAPFLAVALATGADAIWTNDGHFLEQDRVKVVSTRDLVKMLEIQD